MPTITWLGEGDDGPKKNVGFKGMEFEVGKAVECDNEAFLEAASKNKYYKVEGYEPKTPPGGPQTVPSVVGLDVQHPVPKPGEPIKAAASPKEPTAPEGESKPSSFGFDPIPPARK